MLLMFVTSTAIAIDLEGEKQELRQKTTVTLDKL
jgi:hypothetical protein